MQARRSREKLTLIFMSRQQRRELSSPLCCLRPLHGVGAPFGRADFAHAELLDFPGHSGWKLGDEFYIVWNLSVHDLATAKRAGFVLVQRLASPALYPRPHL